ncbi:MAG: type III pantothenate kinase [Candidatus Midichloriaceae bacterium]|jgi:type III pantothenate kinase
MLLVVDIGNTNIVIGVFDNNLLTHVFRFDTERKASTEYYIEKISSHIKSEKTDVNMAILSSVVRSCTMQVVEAIKSCFRIVPLIANECKHDLILDVDDPKKLGSDILANAIASRELYGKNSIFIDFGTATVVGLIIEGSKFLGASILPGVFTSYNALIQNTDLNYYDTSFKSSNMNLFGKNTQDAVMSGMRSIYYYGIKGVVSDICAKYKGDFTVVVTGGISNIIKEELDFADIFDPYLTLNGLRFLYNMNR